MRLFLLASLVVSGVLHAACIREISSLQEIVPCVQVNKNKKLLTIFDIDDTIAHSQRAIGSDAFFTARVTAFMQEGYDATTAVHYTLPDYFYVQFHMPLVFTENVTPDVFFFLKKNSIDFMALTARSLYIAERTIEQLDELGIVFTFYPQKNIVLPLAHPSLYRKGILFCGLNDKGEALVSLLDYLGYRPDHVIFVDDKYKNLLSVQKALIQREIEFDGFRLSVRDDFVKHFDLATADQDLAVFKRSLQAKK